MSRAYVSGNVVCAAPYAKTETRSDSVNPIERLPLRSSNLHQREVSSIYVVKISPQPDMYKFVKILLFIADASINIKEELVRISQWSQTAISFVNLIRRNNLRVWGKTNLAC